MRRCFLLIFLAGCVSQTPVAEVKDTYQDTAGWQIFSQLFEEIMGRSVGDTEVVSHRQDNAITSVKLFAAWLKNRDNEDYYVALVDLLLNSQQYIDEGFFHLHSSRLLLDGLGNEDFLRNSAHDFQALKLEMQHLAQTDNYWEMLTYRTKWLSIGYEDQSGINLQTCMLIFMDDSSDDSYHRSSSDEEESEGLSEDEKDSYVAYKQRLCIDFLLASFLPDYNYNEGSLCHKVGLKNEYFNKKFSSVFSTRCGEEDSVNKDEFCQELNSGYQDVLGKNYYDIDRIDTDVCNESIGDKVPEDGYDDNNSDSEVVDPLRTKISENIIKAIYFYISLYMSSDANTFVKVEVPEHKNISDLVQKGEQQEGGRGEVFFLQAKLPPALQGIHATPFWLSRHRTSASNRGLHRARLLLYSWFCEHIAPDAANLSGEGAVTVPDNLRDFFADDDKHASSDPNCFGCHRRVQPLANYFGLLAHGVPYNQDLEFDDSWYHRRLLEKEFFHTRPGGYYNTAEGKFFADASGKAITGHGMSGLADLLSKHPLVPQCVVKSTWNGMFGQKNSLRSKEVAEAVEKFKQSDFNYREMLKHLLLSDKAKTFFTKGKTAFEAIITPEDCDSAKLNDEGVAHGKTAANVIATTCAQANCHAQGQMQWNGRFITDTHEFISDPTVDVLERIYKRLLGCGVRRMPDQGYLVLQQEGSNYQVPSEKQEKLLTCFLQGQAGENTELGADCDDVNNTEAIDMPVPSNHGGR